MEDSDQALKRQEARYRAFRKRPWLGVWLLLLGIGIPAATAIVLALIGSEIFFSSLLGGVEFSALVAISTGISTTVVLRLRASAIDKELEQ